LQELHPLLAQAFDADVRALLTGLQDFSPKPWPERFREIQAAGGHVEIVQSRIAQGDLIAVGAGTLSLNANGRIDGELQMTVAGIEKVIPVLMRRMLEDGVPQATLDRLAPGVKAQDVNNLLGALNRAIPGLGNVVKQNSNANVVVTWRNAIGKDAVLEGKKAQAFPLRFVDGAVFLGSLPVGQVPPLF